MTQTKQDKRSRKTRTVSRWNSCSHIDGHSATLIENSSNIYLCLFSIKITKQNKTGSIMGSCNADAHIAEDHIHTDVQICTIKEPHQKYRLGEVSNRFLGWEERAKQHVYVTQTSPSASTTILPNENNNNLLNRQKKTCNDFFLPISIFYHKI